MPPVPAPVFLLAVVVAVVVFRCLAVLPAPDLGAVLALGAFPCEGDLLPTFVELGEAG